MDYKLLRALAVVVQEGGFEKGASKLNITQSAVSQRVRLLEEFTGQILISRTTPPTLTDRGQLLMKHYLQVQQLEGDLFESISLNSTDSYQPITIGINADSLATWFLPAMVEFLKRSRIAIELKIDDQEVTHNLLRTGTVMGCISSRELSIQGCSTHFLGEMVYLPLASPEFFNRYFKTGFMKEAVKNVPAVIFNRKDDLHFGFLREVLGVLIPDIPIHYIPSSEKFVDAIVNGLGYGMVPELQATQLLKSGRLIPLFPDYRMAVRLFWHCWNLKSSLLVQFTDELIKKSRQILTTEPQ